MIQRSKAEPTSNNDKGLTAPTISVPKGGGATRGIGEKFGVNPVTGTGSLTVPLAISPGRDGFAPQLSLSYDSGSGNGPFGLGWGLKPPCITRKTEKGLPRYEDGVESDVFLFAGAEDLVPAMREAPPGNWLPDTDQRDGYAIVRYRPRIESLFARIERWSRLADGETFWRSIGRDNVTTIYGRTGAERIADPSDPQRVFSWLISESYDDKGNAIRYTYVAEDSAGVDVGQPHEAHRTPQDRKANRYLKRIQYGNTTSRLVEPDLGQMTWRFEVVFDYGEGHFEELPVDAEGRRFAIARLNPPTGASWPVRQDPFSVYRSGFEVRTYRLCRRVLMFHHFPAELGAPDTLVSSTEFTYAEGPLASFITAASQSGYVRQTAETYRWRSLPPLEFTYTQATVQAEVHDVDPASLENLPIGLDGTTYQWVDLHGEGVPGILSEQAEGWFFKRNLSPITANGPLEARFGPMELVGNRPRPSNLGAGRQQLMDLEGDGRLDLVQWAPPLAGFSAQKAEGDWERFTPFPAMPNLAWNDPNLRFVDLTGDGHADLLITDPDLFTWYPSLAEAGFGPAEVSRMALDEERGPRALFADATQSLYLADLSGDGLSDLVRIRNGEVCYWPNLGYGRFGKQVLMANAPWLDSPDEFDQKRIRLADIDGSGLTDIIYLGHDGLRLYLNKAGNSWSEAQPIPVFPSIDQLSEVRVADLFGNGTACLIWSSPLPGAASQPMRYVDLMGGQKPHLLVTVINNLGAETHVRYLPSTHFFVADRLAGRPWITSLPFPVHVVERVETHDRISRNRFVTRYAYHHGYFDGIEREFRGFGLVEQWDTEEFATLSQSDDFPGAANIDAASHVPPVLTRTWYHTGAYLGGERISQQYQTEYFREPGLSAAQVEAMLLDDTLLPTDLTPPLTPDEGREAVRALKGSILRQEVYGLDGTAEAGRPYRVSERNYTLERLQPRGDQKAAVFLTHAREAIELHYERKLYQVNGSWLADPRVSHSLTLAVDPYGNVLQSATVGYGRRYQEPDPLLTSADRAKQKATLVTWTENQYTNPVLTDDQNRTPQPYQARTYELVGAAPTASLANVTNRFGFTELGERIAEASDLLHDLPYADVGGQGAAPGEPWRRLIKHVRTRYRADDLTVLLDLGLLEPLALPGERYSLAFTPDLVSNIYGSRVDEAMLVEGGYVHSEGEPTWWVPTGRVYYSPIPAHTPAQELAFAQAHFFRPHRFQEPFGATTIVAYDGHDLLLQASHDALGNLTEAASDYRVLKPSMVTDPNRNRAAVAFDALGLVVGTAQMGKEGEAVGDSLAGIELDLPDSVIAAHLQDPLSNPNGLLGQATTRLVYDLFAYMRTRSDPAPAAPVSYTLIREIHDADLAPGEQSPVQHRFTYGDGFGREIQTKVQAEPGPLLEGGPVVGPRWVGSGWTIQNNKGKPVRQYEPFFSGSQAFEFAHQSGVSPILLYDPVERIAATLSPNHTYAKTVYDPWRQVAWDTNDTVLQADPADDPDVGGLFHRLTAAEYLPTWHAQRAAGAMGGTEQSAAARAAAHAGTPTVAYLDSLGRTIVTIVDNGVGAQYATRTDHDIESNRRAVIDPRERIVLQSEYELLGQRIREVSIDGGTSWVLNAIGGKPLYHWDSRDQRVHTLYDLLRRPVAVRLSIGASPETVVARTEYGEGQGDALNHRGRPFRQYDGAGLVTFEAYDFKGNPVDRSRRLTVAYQTEPDWATAPPLEPTIYTTQATFDALNRPATLTAPDNSLVKATFNEANLLERLAVNLRGAPVASTFIEGAAYNAKGQRTWIRYGNGVETEQTYDQLTSRLIRSCTTRTGDGARLQDLSYTYDPVENLIATRDLAQQVQFFANQSVTPHADYLYDALYRLIGAEGREHIGQMGAPQPAWDDGPRTAQPQPNDGLAMRRYVERYEYDEVGNIAQMLHSLGSLQSPGATVWNRRYQYHPQSNRLLSTSLPGEADQPTYSVTPDYLERYTYDGNGNMSRMPHLAQMAYNHQDRLQTVDLGGGGRAYYLYDSSGQRVRTVIERLNGTRQKERLYLDGVESYREFDGSGQSITLERESLPVMDGAQRIALVESRTQGSDGSPAQLIRFQVSGRLRTISLELDHLGQVLSYEEYHPYGSTAYQAVRAGLETNPKRYRFTGKERDEETGLYYHGARHFVPWLGRWTGCDPAGLVDGLNAYQYVRGNPLRFSDPGGTDSNDERSVEIGPARVNTPRFDRALDPGHIFSGDRTPGSGFQAGSVFAHSDLSIPRLDLKGTGQYRFTQYNAWEFGASAKLDFGALKLNLTAGAHLSPPPSLGTSPAQAPGRFVDSLEHSRGELSVVGQLKIGPLPGPAFSATAHVNQGSIRISATLGLPGGAGGGPSIPLGGLSASGHFGQGGYNLSGRFWGLAPGLFAGRFTLSNTHGFRAQGLYAGPQFSILGHPSFDPLASQRPPNASASPSDPAPSGSQGPTSPPNTLQGTIPMYEPGVSIGLSAFSIRGSNYTIFSAGIAPSTSYTGYSADRAPLPFPLSSAPGFDKVAGPTPSIPMGPGFVLSVSGNF